MTLSPSPPRLALGAALALTVLAGPACPGPDDPAPCGPVAETLPAPYAGTHMACGRRGTDIVLQLFTGAAPPGTVVTAGGTEAVVDEQGRATLRFADEGQDTVDVDFAEGARHTWARFRVRDGSGACTVGDRAPTGALPNDVGFVRCAGGLWPAALTSGDASLDVRGDAARSTPFALGPDGAGANPFAFAPTGDGRAVVTLYATHEIALVDACAGTVLFRDRARDDSGALAQDQLLWPRPLRTPLDTDEDGTVDDIALAVAWRHPQAVVVAGDVALVAYTNLLNPADDDNGQILAPGVLARFRIRAQRLELEGHTVLPDQNPQGLAVGDEGVWVSASGAFGPYADGYQPISLGSLALYPLDVAGGGPPVRRITAGHFAPATPVLVGDRIAVGSLVRPAVAVLHPEDTSFDTSAIIELPGTGLDAVFTLIRGPAELVFAPVFSTDRLHTLDLGTLTADPAPLPAGGFDVRAAGVTLTQGLLDVAAAPDGTQALALLSLSNELVTLAPHAEFGP